MVILLIKTMALGGRKEVKNSEVTFPNRNLILEVLTEVRPTTKTHTPQMSSNRLTEFTQLGVWRQNRDRDLPLATDRGGAHPHL